MRVALIPFVGPDLSDSTHISQYRFTIGVAEKWLSVRDELYFFLVLPPWVDPEDKRLETDIPPEKMMVLQERYKAPEPEILDPTTPGFWTLQYIAAYDIGQWFSLLYGQYQIDCVLTSRPGVATTYSAAIEWINTADVTPILRVEGHGGWPDPGWDLFDKAKIMDTLLAYMAFTEPVRYAEVFEGARDAIAAARLKHFVHRAMSWHGNQPELFDEWAMFALADRYKKGILYRTVNEDYEPLLRGQGGSLRGEFERWATEVSEGTFSEFMKYMAMKTDVYQGKFRARPGIFPPNTLYRILKWGIGLEDACDGPEPRFTGRKVRRDLNETAERLREQESL